MKRCAVLILLCLLLTACSGVPDEIEAGMELRSRVLQASECSFLANITADYGDKVHIFEMACKADTKGDLTFTVLQPETISGISGKLAGEGGSLIFDDTALHFELLAEEQPSPISAPWILMKTLRSGYITSACQAGERIHLSVDDSFEQEALRLDIWLGPENIPEQADILYDGRRILTVDVRNFQIL